MSHAVRGMPSGQELGHLQLSAARARAPGFADAVVAARGARSRATWTRLCRALVDRYGPEFWSRGRISLLCSQPWLRLELPWAVPLPRGGRIVKSCSQPLPPRPGFGSPSAARGRPAGVPLSALQILSMVNCTAMVCSPGAVLTAVATCGDALDSFGQLTARQMLSMERCTALGCLSDSFGPLPALQTLSLENCMASRPRCRS